VARAIRDAAVADATLTDGERFDLVAGWVRSRADAQSTGVDVARC
jgi:hypothetical protein